MHKPSTPSAGSATPDWIPQRCCGVWHDAAATIDPASNLITAAFAEPMNGGESELRPVNPVWFQQFYFE